MIRWLDGKQYQVGIIGEGIDVDREVRWAKAVLPAVGEVLPLIGAHPAAGTVGALLGTIAEGGAAPEVVKDALKPHADLADLLGFRVTGSNAWLLPVIYADRVPLEELKGRVHLFGSFGGSLKNLGERIPLWSTQTVWIEPLFVFFDSATLGSVRDELIGNAYFDEQAIVVQPDLVDVPNTDVMMARGTSTTWGSIRDLLQTVGVGNRQFEQRDLRDVLSLQHLKRRR